MEFNPDFTTEELQSWLHNYGFSTETTERIETECLDGESLCDVYDDAQELRHFFPKIKERLQLKKLVGEIVQEENESRCPLSSPFRQIPSTSTSTGGGTSTCSSARSSEDWSLIVASPSSSSSKSSSVISDPVLSSTPKPSNDSLSSGSSSSTPRHVSQPIFMSESSDVNAKTAEASTGKSTGKNATSTMKVVGWISKFQLPSRFSASVEMGLKHGQLTNNQQNEFVRDVCTCIMNYTTRPSKEERVHVAKQMIAEYPCMADKKLVDCSNEWSSLEVKIFNRMKKLQKPKRLAGNLESSCAPSKGKRQRLNENSWSEKPVLPEGETLASLRCYADENRPELLKKPTNVKLHKEFMDHTFALRRHDILTAPRPVNEVLKEYPSLRKFIHLKGEMCRILGSDDIPTNVRDKYQTWQGRVIKFASKCKDKEVKTNMDSMEAALSEEGCDKTEIENRSAFLILNKLLKQKNGRKRGIQEEVITILPRDSDIEASIGQLVQPQVVVVGDIFDIDLMYIVVEGSILCSIPQQRMLDAVLGLLASFYVFNMAYKEGKATLNFLEQTLLGIGRGQTLVTVTSLINALSNI